MAKRVYSLMQDTLIFAQKTSDAELSKQLGLTIRQIINRRYFLRKRQFTSNRTIRISALANRRLEVKELLNKGYSLSKCAEILETTKGTVSGFVRRRKLRRKEIFI